MRDKVAGPKFLLQKKIEPSLNKKYSDKWVPAYVQVTFNPHIRYSDALVTSIQQEAIMQDIMSIPGIENKSQTEEVENIMLARLYDI